jgi:asparagine synthase (glutamine-hydrolysing)
VLSFGSELKALRTCSADGLSIDRDALTSYFRYAYVPDSRSIFAGVHKLAPGHWLSFSARDDEPRIQSYWSIEGAIESGRTQRFKGTDADATDALEALLLEVTDEHMLSDVPLGAFLSGGVDSSTVTALMQARSTRPVKTFSIGFDEASHDESVHARAVAEHLKTEHHEYRVTAREARDVIPLLPHFYDEPFADSSAIPTYLVSKAARQSVTVALTGDGGDEVFAGYTRYRMAQLFAQFVDRLPQMWRRSGAAALRGIPSQVLDQLVRMLPPSKRPPHAGDRLHKLAEVLAEDREGFYLRLVSQCWRPSDFVMGGNEPLIFPTMTEGEGRAGSFVDWMQYADMKTYLPGDILTKLDRASMAVSLESRVPLLDHRIVEFAWSLPQTMKLRDGDAKWILKRVLYRHVPRKLIERPKMGFGVPIAEWLRGPLREWADDLLTPARLNADGLLNAQPIRRAWDEHASGRRNWQYQIWTVLMFQAWREKWR